MASTPEQCRTIQLLEPDDQLLVATSFGSADPSLDESGSVALSTDLAEVEVTFRVTKAGEYRFEYLYVDALGQVLPGGFDIVPIIQTPYGFTVDLSGIPLETGHVLRWRVVVIQIGIAPPAPTDQPESFYIHIPQGAHFLQVLFSVQRSTDNYGFSELRVENLIDLPGQQTPIWIQVCQRFTSAFGVAISPSPPNNNYFLVARVP